MNNLDLNLDNYDLPDLLKLFKLDYKFTEENLKQAKRMVLMTHPDKSKLPKEYFLFFSKAYKILYSIYKFRVRGNKDQPTVYSVDKDVENEKLLKDVVNNPNFNKIFNELFEKNRIEDEATGNGYGDWLKSNEDIDTRKTTLTDMNETFNNKKREVRALIIQKDVEELGGQGYSDLGGDIPENYSSELFSKLTYEDVKKAHIETVVPVTGEDMRENYRNVEALRRERGIEEINNKPLSLEQGNKYLQQRLGDQDKQDTRRAFRLARQELAAQKANENLMSSFKQIRNL
tara:strand:+ start:503 stop:1366 length:864 start_codon:yes stop_codon:yes gene_type:complete